MSPQSLSVTQSSSGATLYGRFLLLHGAPNRETLESLFGVDFVKSPLLPKITYYGCLLSWVIALQLPWHKQSLLFLTFGTHFAREPISHFWSHCYYITKSNGPTYKLSSSSDHSTLTCLPSHYLLLTLHVEPLFGVVFFYYMELLLRRHWSHFLESIL